MKLIKIFNIVKEVSGNWKVGSIERQKFYKESKNTCFMSVRDDRLVVLF